MEETDERSRRNSPVGKRWHRFMHPYGRRRRFSPRAWDWRGRVLVLGETVALLAALAAIPAELSGWSFGPWLVIAATLCGTLALLLYAVVLVSEGEPPLTTRSAHTIRQVVDAMELEQQGVAFDWDNIRDDGGIPSDFSNWARLDPELKAIMDKHDMPLLAAATVLNSQRQSDSTPDDT